MHSPVTGMVHYGRSISLGRFTMMVALIFALIGLLFGVVGLYGSLVGMHVFFQFGSWGIAGPAAGAAGMIIMPALFALTGVLLSLITYRPVNWVLQRL